MKKFINIILVAMALLVLTGCYFTEFTQLTLAIVDHGQYDDTRNLISMSCNNDKAKIHYSYGSKFLTGYNELYQPQTYYHNGSYYSGILIKSGSTISAIATCGGSADSEVFILTASMPVATPVIINQGLYMYDTTKRIVTITCATSGASIKYTTDGSTPKTYSASYSPRNYLSASGVSYIGILVDADAEVKAIGVKNDNKSDVASMSYVANPVITDRGLYAYNTAKRIVSVSCSTSGAAIRYTTDGSTPTDASALYNPASYSLASGGYCSGILVNAGCEFKAVAIKNGSYSDVITMSSVDTPVISVCGVYAYNTSKRIVSMTCATSGVTINYTKDGSTPTNSSSLYSPGRYYSATGEYFSGILVDVGSEIKAVATKYGYLGSGVSVLSDSSVSVNLNSQWRSITDSTVSYDSSAYNAYESSSNYHVHSSTATMMLTLNGYQSFTIQVMSDGESSYDYVKVYDIDSSSSIKVTTRNNQRNWVTVVFDNISSGEHTIRIEYSKDGSGHSGRDRGFVLVPRN